MWASDPAFPDLSQPEAAALAALLKTPAAAAAAVGGRGGSSSASGSSKSQQAVTDVTIGGKVYEARVTAAPGVEGGEAGVLLVCRSKGGMLGLGGGKEGAVVAATGQALVMGLWNDKRAEVGCSTAVQRLAQVLVSYGY